jgi:hypothetical protein
VTCFGLDLIIYFWNELDQFVGQISYGESSSHVPSLSVREAAFLAFVTTVCSVHAAK